ncbi:aminotransferase class I/II-fold pyridoxal phosphate-dependent enzyme [Aquicella lusitana]|uniref:8-amino-7-oxononanoate synthase n=1 Tax=Aquicella lusitana TaxID=254246 RepID=A0A370GFG0_9COXI|nr:8-amino-7-oxononanoate synthase [Aquicella lusitana]RDI42427.1 8-amino-7-oxononanoate synthase [Aquicella lusitana]VVC74111.1 8-amino-7-oxononanoate synthase [Aquicella lusitana]
MKIIPSIQNKLDQRAARFLLRQRYIIDTKHNNEVFISGKRLINFCSNDYLNLSGHVEIKNAFMRSAQRYGTGSCSSALISGYSKSHYQLEETVADYLNQDRAILFNSGYHANLGVLTALAHKNSLIIADKFCHASLIDGIQLSQAKFHRYRHHDLNHASALAEKYKHSPLLFVTESVFSMEGNITDLRKLSSLASQHKAALIVDDAHGFGVLGAKGKGIIEHLQMSATDITCLIIPFGKALGSFGAIVSGSEEITEAILQLARTYCYSTALPPAICDATRQAIRIMQAENWRREKLLYLIKLFIQEAKARQLPLTSDDETPIKSILIRNNQLALRLQQRLMQMGWFVSCIRPPTVPDQTSRIRLSLNCMHTEKQIIALLDHIKTLFDIVTKTQ